MTSHRSICVKELSQLVTGTSFILVFIFGVALNHKCIFLGNILGFRPSKRFCPLMRLVPLGVYTPGIFLLRFLPPWDRRVFVLYVHLYINGESN